MADGSWYDADIDHVIISEEQIREKIDELAKQVPADYADADGRAPAGLRAEGRGHVHGRLRPRAGPAGPSTEMEFMAVSSYGQGTTSSGVVRILKDLDRDIAGRHVLVVEDIVDSGLTLSWLMKYLESRQRPASRWWPCSASRTRSRCRSRSATWASTSRRVRGRLRAGLRGALPELPYVGVLKPEVYARS